MDLVQYRPVKDRTPDSQYRDRLVMIRDAGIPARSFHGIPSRTYMGLPAMRFDLSNGIPLATIRDLGKSWKSAIGEILAFINGVRTQRNLVEEFEVNKRFWGTTVTAEKCAEFGLPEGDLGDGSYGDAFANFRNPENKPVHQVRNVLEQIRRAPDVRTHWIDPWVPYYTINGENSTRRVVVAPCHGWMHWRVLDGRLHLQMHQRSADMPIGVVFNTFQYAALLLAFSHVLQIPAGWFYHSFSDAHIYENQMEKVNELVAREPRVLPILELTDDAPDDLFGFRPRHFVLKEYDPHPAMNDIPFAV